MTTRSTARVSLWLLWFAAALVAVASPFLAPGRGLADTVPDGFRSTLFATGLTAPTAMEFAPDGRLFVCEQGGKLRVIKNGTLLPTPFLSVATDASVERGLLGVTFDPQFPDEPYVYVYYTVPGSPAHNRVSRFTAAGDVAAPGSEQVLLDLDPLSAGNHNGGALHFGPDGYLYIAVGENARSSNAQALTNLLGKVLRMGRDGSIPPDNPFVGSAVGKNQLIWALGLRNPYTFAFQPGSGRMYINDVGQSVWEEIDLGAAGANYGWPTQEGPAGPNSPSFTRPVFAYSHSDAVLGGCAITGGAFYNPVSSRFPQAYVGRYFFADFCGNYIASMDPANPGAGAAVFAADVNTPVDLRVGPDGALYYLSRALGAGQDRVYRIDYTVNAPPVIAVHPADLLVGTGQPAHFTVSATGAEPLSYQWERDGMDIPGADEETYTLPMPGLGDSGAAFRVRVTNAFGEAVSYEGTLTVVNNSPPIAAIVTPANGALYKAGDTVSYSGAASDPEEGTLPASAFTWWVDFHHDTHHHPFLPETSGAKSGSFTIPTTGETSANVWYRIYLRVTDSAGLSDTVFRDLQPRRSTLGLQTDPPGLELTLDGQPVTAPSQVSSVVGITRTLGAAETQAPDGQTLQLEGWSDGGAPVHDISTPQASTTYTATYRLTSGVPANLQAQAVSAGRVRLTWTDTSTSEAGFRIERRTGAGSWSEVGQTGPDTPTFEDAAVSQLTSYTYRVRAVVGTLLTLPSGEASVTTPRAGRLVLGPARLNFGIVRVGRSRTLSFSARNAGRGPLSITVNPAAAPFTVNGERSFTLAPGRRRALSVTFSPAVAGLASTKITVRSDDPARPSVSYTLTGRGR